jgi:hypothetical protein
MCAMPWFVIYSKTQYALYQLYLWVIVIGIPDISSNVYGNAIMSEIKIFICCVMIMVRFRKKPLNEALFIENYIWIFFVHDALVWLAFIQIGSDWKTKKEKKLPQYKEEIKPVSELPKRVINASDFKNMFK